MDVNGIFVTCAAVSHAFAGLRELVSWGLGLNMPEPTKIPRHFVTKPERVQSIGSKCINRAVLPINSEVLHGQI